MEACKCEKGGDEDKQSDDDEPVLLVLEHMNRDRKRQADMVESDLHKSVCWALLLRLNMFGAWLDMF